MSMLEKSFKPAEIEQRLYRRWEETGVFAHGKASDSAPFALMMPPPNVTGKLHMGHALNMSLQDLLTRYWRMRGRDTLWQPGTDHAGIATQMVVERDLANEGLTRHDLGREKFLERVWEWKVESGGTIVRQLRRLGTSPDWERERFTMDDGLSRAVRKVFVRLHKEGMIYRDKRLVNWDPKLHTAISDLEVEQRPTKGRMWHIRYPVEGMKDRFITVATTRPETMLGDTAIAVNAKDDRYKDLIGKHAVLPLVGRKIIIVADEHADPEQGSGAVKITPAHDFNDFEVGKRHDLPIINIFDANAYLNENTPEAYRGMERYAAREKILADLDKAELIERIEPHEHVLPYGDRSGVVIEPWLTDQWFVDAATLAVPAIKAVETGRTRFVPEQWANTYFEWMRNIQPWCVSRQLWWGHRIPAWYGPDGTIFVEETEEAAKDAAHRHYGEKTVLKQDTDVLDTWFSSALWPFSTLGWPDETPELERFYPGNVLITGFDIIFFWVARMMMMGLHFMGDVPFREVYIHALVRDEKGQKMSKSKGNVIDPLGLIDKYGTDALRFTLTAMSAQGRDVKMSEKRVEGYRNFATKLWNAARYCQMNEARPDPCFYPAEAGLAVNRWIIGELVCTARAMDTAIEAYRFNEVADVIYRFVWGSFCDWYLEFTKPILTGGDEAAKTETRAVTAWVLDQMLTLLHPVMPFITEELYGALADRDERLLISADWPIYPDSLIDTVAADEMNWIVELVSAVRSLRADMNVPASAKIILLLKDADAFAAHRLARHKELILRLARLESADILDGPAPIGAALAVIRAATIVLPLADVIDLEQERARLVKEIGKIVKEIGKIDAKLANADFMNKAPAEVIDEQHKRLAIANSARDKLEGALASIGVAR